MNMTPDMNNFFNNFKMSLDEVESFLYAYEVEGQSVETLAKDWVEKNRSDIDAWLKG